MPHPNDKQNIAKARKMKVRWFYRGMTAKPGTKHHRRWFDVEIKPNGERCIPNAERRLA